MAARAGKLSLHFVNTSGAGILVAAVRRHRPAAVGQPDRRRRPRRRAARRSCWTSPTCTRRRGQDPRRPQQGRSRAGELHHRRPRASRPPTRRCSTATPPGAILPFAGHKGYGLGILCEVLAGALTGGGCSNPATPTASSTACCRSSSTPLLPGRTRHFAAEIQRFIAWVKSSEKPTPTATSSCRARSRTSPTFLGPGPGMIRRFHLGHS